MAVKFESKVHPEMNPFFSRLQKALENLPNNPKPECKGFCLADYNSYNDILTNEKIGLVPDEKKSKYRHLASKKVTLTLLYNVSRSKEIEDGNFEETCPQGSFNLFSRSRFSCTGVSAHVSPIDEAISMLHELAKVLIRKHVSSISTVEIVDYVNSDAFYQSLLFETLRAQKLYSLEHEWAAIIAELMTEN